MSLTDITNTINQEAESMREKILKDADKKVEALKTAFAEKKDKLEKAYNAETEQIKNQNVATVTGTSEREQKDLVDTAKREIVDQIFDEALDVLAKLDDTAYTKLLVGQLKTLPKDFGKCEAYASPERTAVTKKALSEAGVSASVNEDESITQGGLRLVGGSFEYDLTFEKMMKEQKNALEIEIAEILFEAKEQ